MKNAMDNANNSEFYTTTAMLPQQLPLAAVLLLSVPAFLIILLTIFGNLLVLLFKARVGRTNTTLLVWNLGLTDFLVGVFVLPLGAIYLINRRWTLGHLLCRIWVGADVTFCTCSVVTICIISVDRYLAVTRPLRYKSVMTKLKVAIAIILIWAFSLGILLATVRWDTHPKTGENKTCFVGDEIRYLAHSVVFAFFLPASVTLTLYWRIYSLARDRQRALDRGFIMILGHNMNFLTNTLSQTTALRVHVGKHNGMVEHQRRVLRTHERIAKTLGVVSCSFLFCWLPFFTLYLFNYQCENCIPSLIIDIASWLGYCNSMLNPIIYSFTVKEFKRSAFCVLLPIWQCGHKWLPKFVSKPPDPKSAQRIVRKKPQMTTQQQHQRKTRTTFPAPTPMSAFYMDAERKRRTPPRARNGAIASLMINANISITQNALTSAAMKKKYRERKSRGETATTEGEATNGKVHEEDEDEEREERRRTKGIISNKQKQTEKMESMNRLMMGNNGQKRSMIMMGENNRNRMSQKLLRKQQRRGSSLDDYDVRQYTESELFSRSGLITTTLLLAASESGFRHHRGEGAVRNSLPASGSFSSISSDLTSSQSKSIRMPCKLELGKVKKRHSVCDPSQMAKNDASALIRQEMSKKKKRAIKASHRRALFAIFKKNRKLDENRDEEEEAETGRSSPIMAVGMWKRARALMMMRGQRKRMSGSNSQGSVASRKKQQEKSECGGGEGGNSRRDEETREDREKTDVKIEEEGIQIICTSEEVPL